LLASIAECTPMSLRPEPLIILKPLEYTNMFRWNSGPTV
jgi:hypothetical protein